MSSVRFMFILIILYYFQALADGFEKPLSWEEARRECKRQNKILSPLKSVRRNLDTHFRSIRSVWTSNYGLNLGCNISTGFCDSLYIQQIPKSEHYEGLCEKNFSVTGTSKHFQIGSNNTFKLTCKRGIPVDLFDMSELGHAIEKMEVNTNYWINSTNIATDSFVRHCMLYTRYRKRTGYEHLTKTDCREKYPFMCSEGDSYGTVISKITFLNIVDLTTQAVLKTNQSEVNSSEKDGYEAKSSWVEARNKCKTQNKILFPNKTVHRQFEHHYRTNKSLWTSDYIIHLGCNISTGVCSGLDVEQVPQNESHFGLCQQDSSATVSQTKSTFRIGFESHYERKCSEGSLSNISNMKTLRNVFDEMSWNTKYWINSINLDIESFVLDCMLFTKYPNRTGNLTPLTASDCRKKYEFKCIKGDHYGTVISKINHPRDTNYTPVQVWNIHQSGSNSDDGDHYGTVISKTNNPSDTDYTPVQVWNINQSGSNSDDVYEGDLVWKVSCLTLSGGIVLFGLLVTCLKYRKKLSFSNIKGVNRIFLYERPTFMVNCANQTQNVHTVTFAENNVQLENSFHDMPW